jgi:hypothetical protein
VPAARLPKGSEQTPARAVFDDMQRALIVIGLAIAGIGILWPWLSKLPLGRLPGDIRVETASGGFYFPIVTCVVVSVVLSLLVWLFRK